MVLEVKNVCKSFDNQLILDNVNFHLKEGQSLAIIGPSGSGKSTLIRLINMLDKVDKGEIDILGDYICKEKDGVVEYNSEENLKALRQKYGMVFQNFNLFPHMSVINNVAFALKHIKNETKQNAQKLALTYLEKVGLFAKAANYPHELSGGQKQRVAIARALALQPQILFFDEPTSSLDPELTREVLNVILDLVKQNMTMVIVTHEMALASECDRVIMMDNSKIIFECTGKELNNSDNERLQHFLNV